MLPIIDDCRREAVRLDKLEVELYTPFPFCVSFRQGLDLSGRWFPFHKMKMVVATFQSCL